MLNKNRLRRIGLFAFGVLLVSIASQCANKEQTTPYSYDFRNGWDDPSVPENNLLTHESIALGKALFYDASLSIDSTISCSSCHKAENGFADNIPVSFGVEGRKGFRNSGTLTNVAYLPYFNRDGGVKSLDIFASVPIEEHQEMGFNLLLAGKRLNLIPKYNQAAQKAYNRELDGFVITRALASFLRTFISDNSLYDQYINKENGVVLNDSQLRGKGLFFGSKANCSKCHSGNQFSDYSFQNNGLYKTYAHKDRGRERITLNPNDEGKFRVATLRNIELSAPYMHDGSIPTLELVLKHYSNHGSDHKNKNSLIDSISLSAIDERDIIAFLKTLTDHEFIHNSDFVK